MNRKFEVHAKIMNLLPLIQKNKLNKKAKTCNFKLDNRKNVELMMMMMMMKLVSYK